MDKRDQWEEAIRSKLQDYEAETEPEDWQAIANRLPEAKGRVIPLRLQRYAAAAAIALLLLSGGYFYYNRLAEKPVIAEVSAGKAQPEAEKPGTVNPPSTPTAPPSQPLIAAASPVQRVSKTTATRPSKTKEAPEQELTPEQAPLSHPTADVTPEQETAKEPEPVREQVPPEEPNDVSALLADASPVSTEKRSQRRWGFGLGGGSYSVGDNSAQTVSLLSSPVLKEGLVYNAEASPALNAMTEKRNVSHKLPVSFGLGFGYALNDRWALQSGLTYTMLASEWQTFGKYLGESKQRLHFIGIPLSMNYKIAEWNRFRFYATGGVMTEWNVSGQIRTQYYDNLQKILQEKESVRMKEWLWSVNARAGVSYPLIRFVNAYVEGGANYYFDNGSFIETIRSDKPFHVSLQAGIRFGF
jgi:hypothetical protein